MTKTVTEMPTTRLYGMAEAERLIAVGRVLYEATKPRRAWTTLSLSEQRPFIDRASQTS
jgi:hypothetical protein